MNIFIIICHYSFSIFGKNIWNINSNPFKSKIINSKIIPNFLRSSRFISLILYGGCSLSIFIIGNSFCSSRFSSSLSSRRLFSSSSSSSSFSSFSRFINCFFQTPRRGLVWFSLTLFFFFSGIIDSSISISFFSNIFFYYIISSFSVFISSFFLFLFIINKIINSRITNIRSNKYFFQSIKFLFICIFDSIFIINIITIFIIKLTIFFKSIINNLSTRFIKNIHIMINLLFKISVGITSICSI